MSHTSLHTQPQDNVWNRFGNSKFVDCMNKWTYKKLCLYKNIINIMFIIMIIWKQCSRLGLGFGKKSSWTYLWGRVTRKTSHRRVIFHLGHIWINGVLGTNVTKILLKKLILLEPFGNKISKCLFSNFFSPLASL